MNQDCKDYANCGIGAVSGAMVYKYVPKYLLRKPLKTFYENKFASVSKADNDVFYSAAKEAYKNHNIKDKGITILHIDENNCKDETEKIIKETHEKEAEKKAKRKQKLIDKYKQRGKEYKEPEFNKKLEEWLKKLTAKIDERNRKGIKEVAKGKNACYVPAVGKVLINKEKMSFSIFHEIGHGITHKAGGWKKFNVGFSNLLPFAIPVILAVGLLKNKKEENEKPQGTKDKITTFIKNNCGILASMCVFPKLIDEALASHNGAKLAKDVLQPDKYKKLINMQRFAFSSYALSAALIYCFAKLAVAVRDKIVEQKPVK